MAAERRAPGLDAGESARYHRPRKPVEVRRRASWKRAFWVVARVAVVMLAVALSGGVVFVGRSATTPPMSVKSRIGSSPRKESTWKSCA